MLSHEARRIRNLLTRICIAVFDYLAKAILIKSESKQKSSKITRSLTRLHLGIKLFSNLKTSLSPHRARNVLAGPYFIAYLHYFKLKGHRAVSKLPTMTREVARSRSRSPYRPSHSHHERHDRPRSSRDRSRSPRRTHHHHHHSRHAQKPYAIPIPPAKLPFKARSLTRHDLPIYKPIFAIYLDIQKKLVIEDFTQDELKGRWKSFVGKW